MNLGELFNKTRSENRAAFIGYLPAGFPTVQDSIENINALVSAGCDLIEVGLPFSDPMMDGPTIQDAADIALANGFRTRDLMRVVRETTQAGALCVVMSYWNPILQYGPEKFAEDLAAAGGVGTIIPDLIPEEAKRWQQAAKANGLANIMLVAPSSTNERLELTTAASTGFVYVTSHMGVTGAQSSVDSAAGELVRRTREFTDLPLCVGLGVSNGAQAHEIAQFADGVIVGSALIKAAAHSRDALAEMGAELAAGVRR